MGSTIKTNTQFIAMWEYVLVYVLFRFESDNAQN